MIKFIFSSLRFYWRNHLGVLLGAILAAAVLTGSLLVGDSVDGSLRTVALQRLGSAESALYTPNRFFSRQLAERFSDETAAVLQLRGMALSDEQQINRVQVLGTDAAFWTFAGIPYELQANEVALNEKLAAALGVAVGDDVSLRVEKPGLLPLDAPLSAQNNDRTVRGRFTVARILGNSELGNFSLAANQVVPYNAFVNTQWLEERTELDGKANLMLSSATDPNAALAANWQCEDFGLRFREYGNIVQLESDQIYLGPEAARAAMQLPDASGTLTYLVNSISKGERSTPYSFVMARGGAEPPQDGIELNRWLAHELQAETGDAVLMKYFELLPSGEFVEREQSFNVHAIVEMVDAVQEQHLAPQFPGLTDVDRCADWDVGIPMEEAALEDAANEEYWNQYKQTPKAFVSLAAGQSMWANRFGSLTTVRWPRGFDAETAFRIEFNPAAAGFVFQPVRQQALAAVDQAMDFGELFVGMSFFLIVAALMLTGLLFVFGIQQRAEEMGTLLATGWTPRAVHRLFLLEGSAIALIGSAAGAWLGTGYTKLLILGLSNYWGGAIANSAIQYFAHPETIIAGAVASFICALAAMAIAMRRQAKHPARELLQADFSQGYLPQESTKGTKEKRPSFEYSARFRGQFFCSIGFVISVLGAIGIVVYALTGDVESVTMPFFGAGALLLAGGILLCSIVLRALAQRDKLPRISGMALRNIARRPGRSLTVIGSLACGTFLVFAVSAMKEDITAHADEAWSGTGGFGWFGESTLPILDDLGGVRLRVRDGDDASCLNLNRAQTPRLLGVDPNSMAARKAFIRDESLWALLSTELPEGTIPALVGDTDTAMWGLEASTGLENGAELDYIDEAGNPFKVKLVGQLPMRLSVFQGALLIAEKDFVERFPGESGYRMFLLNQPLENQAHERAGLDVIPAVERLQEFYAVESTYLAMFLVLGALGLAVGSLGMGVVVLRNVQDRRSETALLRAVGYRDSVLRKLLFVEHGLLLLAGLLVGIVSAALAMVPALFITHSQASPIFLIGLLVLVVLCGAGCMAAAIALATRGDALRALRNE